MKFPCLGRRTLAVTVPLVNIVRVLALLSALLMLTVVFGRAGCNKAGRPQISEHFAPIILILGLDDTDSTRSSGHLADSVTDLAHLSLAFDPDKTWVKIFAVRHDTEEIMNGPLPPSDEEFLAELVERLHKKPARDYTHIEKFMRAAAEAARNAHGDVIVILTTDYHCEGMTPEHNKVVSRAAAEMAKNAKIKAFILVNPHASRTDDARRDMKSLGNKLHVVKGQLKPEFVADLLGGGDAR